MQQTSTELALVAPATGGSWLDHATVIDETPLWLAWETAKDAWLESKKRDSGGDNTAKAYGSAMREFFTFAQVPPWQVASADAQEWVRSMAKRGLSGATMNLKLAALSDFYSFVQYRYSKRTPDGREVTLWAAGQANPFDARAVERTKIKPYARAIGRVPSTDELKQILGQINTATVGGKRDFAFLYMVATTCRRCSEVTNLKWGDIEELAGGDFAFRYRYKGGEIKRAVLTRMAYQAICAYLAADGRPPEGLTAEDYVFVPLDPERILRLRPGAVVEPNRPISGHTANGILKKYARRAGVALEKAHIHALRHAGAKLRVQLARERGQAPDLEDIQRVLGHANVNTTMIYAGTLLEDPQDKDGRAAAETLMPKGRMRRQRKAPGSQGALL